MRIKRFLLRYYPPAIIVEYVHRKGSIGSRTIQLFDLGQASVGVDEIVSRILTEESFLLSVAKHEKTLRKLIYKLMDKQCIKLGGLRYESFRSCIPHVLPLTNCVFNKDGTKFLTGSYDGTCCINDTFTGEIEFVLGGHHTSVVYAMAYDYPFCSRIITGSFDKTAIIWDAMTGDRLHHLIGHSGEIVCVNFSHNGLLAVTGSMDKSAKIWDVDSGRLIVDLAGHTGEIISVQFSLLEVVDQSKRLFVLTGSFDITCRVWDAITGECIHVLSGHSGEVSVAKFRFSGDLFASGSIDGTCVLWDVVTGKIRYEFSGYHKDEILDLAFDATGSRIVTASSDGTCNMYSVETGKFLCSFGDPSEGGEIVRVSFSLNGALIVTASTDNTARIWVTSTGELLQVLEHDGIFFADFNYESDLLLTVSKDNSCKIWRRCFGVASRKLSSIESLLSLREDAVYTNEIHSEDFSSYQF